MGWIEKLYWLGIPSLQVLFLFLKVFGFIPHVSWWLVFAPILIMAVLGVSCFMLLWYAVSRGP